MSLLNTTEFEARGQFNGNCLGIRPEAFFPETLDELDEAKAVCGGCEQRQLCLDYAVDTNQDTGVWGGMDEHERRLYGASRNTVVELGAVVGQAVVDGAGSV